MVRLLLLVEKVEGDVLTVVSIPQWCDCCEMFLCKIKLSEIGFNPTMVRLLHPKMVRLQKQTAAFQSHNGAIAADYLKSSVGQAR